MLIKGSNFARFPASTASDQAVAQSDTSPARLLTAPDATKRAQTHSQASHAFHHIVRGSSANALLHHLNSENSLASEVQAAAPTPNHSESSLNAAAPSSQSAPAKRSQLESQLVHSPLPADSSPHGGAAWHLQAAQLDEDPRCSGISSSAFASSQDETCVGCPDLCMDAADMGLGQA